MHFKNLGLALTISAAFGLIACGDDSSSNAGDELIHCTVTRTDYTFKTVSTYMGQYSSFEIVFDENGIITYTSTIPYSEDLKDGCQYENVTCIDGLYIDVSHSTIPLAAVGDDPDQYRKDFIIRETQDEEEECLESDGKNPKDFKEDGK